MRQHFFVWLLAVVTTGILCSCSKDQSHADDFDSRSIEMLGAVCAAMEKQDTSSALKYLQKMTMEFPGDRFASAAYRHEQKRQIITDANELINSTNLNALSSKIRMTETLGLTSPEVLEFTRVGEALNALRLFISKMPWTTVDSLQQNLVQLDIHRNILEKSPAYVSFRKKQDITLGALRSAARSEANARLLDAMDAAVLTGQNLAGARMLATQTATAYPDNDWAKCSVPLNADSFKVLWKQCETSQTLQKALEISVLSQWNKLDKGVSQAVLQALSGRQPCSLCGLWLAARHKLNRDATAAFLSGLTRSGKRLVPSQAIIRELLEKQILPRSHYVAWCWNSPCPGLPELIARIKQVGLKK